MRRVLIVSPHFPPVNAPDMQRVRLALPHLRALGWEPVVLAVHPDSVEGGVRDPLLEATYPADIRVVRVRGLNATLTRHVGVGSLWLRCGPALRAAGDQLLATGEFDLIFFSTTQFGAFQLGPRWRQRFGIAYVLDYQDPWVNPYYRRTGTRPPGGWLRFTLVQLLARRAEPKALRHAAGVVAVSESYGQMLAEAHPWFDAKRVQLLPFGASESDITLAAAHRPAEPLVPSGDGHFHHVYTGRCGPDMALALTVLFRGFKRYLTSHPDEAKKLRFHFIGTGYAPPPRGKLSALPVAEAEGVAEFVQEYCYRVSYFDALHYLVRADAVVGIGSDDASYSASKIFPAILARRPMVLIYHASSLVLRFAQEVSAGVRFSFHDLRDIEPLAEAVHREWFCGEARRNRQPFAPAAFQPFTAEAMTGKLAAIFDRAAAGGAGDRAATAV